MLVTNGSLNFVTKVSYIARAKLRCKIKYLVSCVVRQINIFNFSSTKFLNFRKATNTAALNLILSHIILNMPMTMGYAAGTALRFVAPAQFLMDL